MNLQPLNGHVLLRAVEAATKTASGIYLPETAVEKPTEGVVVAMASDVSKDLSLGDRVIYRKFSGEEITHDGQKLRLLPYADLLAKMPAADAIPA
jgi:chaperonin GroES